MFNQAQLLSKTNGVSSVQDLALVAQVPTTGEKTLRRKILSDGSIIELAISHSVSNENKPTITDRAVIRINRKRVNTETGKDVTASAYLVIASPRGVVTTTETVELVYALLSFFGTSDDGTSNNVAIDTARLVIAELPDVDEVIRRLIAGEA